MLLTTTIFGVVNAIGLVAFALVGASKAIREGFDPFGVCVVGLVTAFGGGTIRDLLVLRVPTSFQTVSNVGFGVVGVVLAIVLSTQVERPDRHPLSVTADTLGLGAFATTGAIVATEVGVSPFGVVVIATINAAGGGALADVLLDRSPFILLRDFYASCAVLGGCTYWLVWMGTNGSESGLAAVGCAAVTAGVRTLAIRYDWDLPNLRERQFEGATQ